MEKSGTVILFIDGYNLIFAASKRMGGFDISQTEAAREKLLGMLARFNSGRSDKITVFFDGGQEAEHLPRRGFSHGMETVFSDARSDADTDIKNAVSHHEQPSIIRVITSDHAIQSFVKLHGAEITSSEEFLDEMTQAMEEKALPQNEPIEKYEGAPPDEVDYWMSVFGDDDE